MCPLSHISPLGLLFVVKPLPHTQQATKVTETASFQCYGTSCILRLPRSRPLSLGGIRTCASKMALLTVGRSLVSDVDCLGHRSEVGVLYALQLTRDISMTVVQLSFRIIRSVRTRCLALMYAHLNTLSQRLLELLTLSPSP